MDLVPNDKLREAVQATGTSHYELAKRMGIMRCDSRRPHLGRNKPDGTGVRRALGIGEFNSQGRRRPPQKFIRYQFALRICRAAGIDPIDVDL